MKILVAPHQGIFEHLSDGRTQKSCKTALAGAWGGWLSVESRDVGP